MQQDLFTLIVSEFKSTFLQKSAYKMYYPKLILIRSQKGMHYVLLCGGDNWSYLAFLQCISGRAADQTQAQY